MAGSAWCGGATVCGSMVIFTGRASFQYGDAGSTMGPLPVTRVAVSGACADAGPAIATIAASANRRGRVMAVSPYVMLVR
jgi:hypothetical protein